MDALTYLIGVAILAIVLTANFFRAAWRLGVMRSFGRRALPWRTLLATTLAGCLPLLGALLALSILPEQPDADASATALTYAAGGLLMHVINDKLIAWGS